MGAAAGHTGSSERHVFTTETREDCHNLCVRCRSPGYTAWGTYEHRLKTARAAWYPHMPCTLPPGGVEEEQRKTLRRGEV